MVGDWAICKEELRLYPARKQRYELFLSGADMSDKPRPPLPTGEGIDPNSRKTNAVSKPTERIAVGLADSEEFQQLKAQVQAVDGLLSILPEEQKRLIELSFFKDRDREFVVDALRITRKRYYQLMERALTRYAIITGRTS